MALAFAALKGWTPVARHTVAASYLAWTLDAHDFFLLTFVFRDIAAEFGTSITKVAVAAMLTLACRPVGAFLFGRLADRIGRRPTLMLNIALYSLLSLSIAFTHDIWSFYARCACFGVAMGGIWGIAASLSMEASQPHARGFVSGLLQSGYYSGFLLAAMVYGFLYEIIGWRGMFMVGTVPAAALIAYIYFRVPESQHFSREHARAKSASTFYILTHHWKIALYGIVLMTAFTFFSHGTQDLYPTFLQVQHHYSPGQVRNIAVIFNMGAIIGSLTFGSISQAFGRRRTAIAIALMALPLVYLWAYSTTPLTLALGAFLIQICVGGAWGVVPAHLNELSPPEARGTFPGTVYQLGNLIASVNAVLQAAIAERMGGNYSIALASVAVCAVLAIVTLLKFGPEAHGADMAHKTTH